MRSASIARFVRISNLLILFVASRTTRRSGRFGVGDRPLYNIHLLPVHIGLFVQSSVIEAQFLSFGVECRRQASVTEYEIVFESSALIGWRDGTIMCLSGGSTIR